MFGAGEYRLIALRRITARSTDNADGADAIISLASVRRKVCARRLGVNTLRTQAQKV
jgi:hypothetical protein